MIRSFIAIDLEPVARARLGAIQDRLRIALRGEPVRWVRPEGIHLTLKFLGDQTRQSLEGMGDILKALAREAEVWHLSIAGVGCFPHASRPRVIWAGVHEATGRLEVWARRLDEALAAAGIEPERRPFQPHLTFARFKDQLSPEGQRRLGGALEELKSEPIADSLASSVELLRSELRPDGAVYTSLTRAPLGPSA